MEDLNNLDNQDIKSLPFGIKFGVIASLSIIIYSLIINMIGFGANEALGYISFIILGIIIFLACKNYKEANTNFISFGKGVGLGMLISLISSVIQSIFSYVYLSYIDNSVIAEVYQREIEKLEQQGVTGNQLDYAVEIVDMMMQPHIMSILAFFVMLFFGLIMSLIVSAIVKNPRPIFE